MRGALITLGLAAVAGFAGGRACGEDVPTLPNAPAPPRQATVRAEVQMVSVSVADARVLVPALQNRKTAEAARVRIQGMLARDEATLLGWPVLWLKTGVRGSAQSIEEDRFPTEFMPPAGPGGPESMGIPWQTIPAWGPSVPTAFETQNVGSSFEAEATVEQDGQVVALNILPKFVRFLDMREWHIQRSPIGIEGLTQRPEYQTAQVTTSLRVDRDAPVLVGVFVLPRPKPHVELFILRAKATLLPPEAATPPTK